MPESLRIATEAQAKGKTVIATIPGGKYVGEVTGIDSRFGSVTVRGGAVTVHVGLRNGGQIRELH